MFGAISYQIKKDNTFLITTFLACISIYLIKYSQELRPYSLLLLTSSLNIFFYFKLLNNPKKKYINSIPFIIFSIINYSTHPFSLIILFSQFFFSLYRYFLFKKSIHFLLFLYLLIFIFYLVINLDYILIQISFKKYMLSYDIKNVLDGFYFPRFFGSKIMGYTYLILLFFLIIKNRSIIFKEINNYLFFFILIIFCYFIPFVYGIINTPVLQDRYIIFILIPVLVLTSCLITELKNKRFKLFLILFIFVITLSNHFIEIFKRVNTKPQFALAFENIKDSGIKNVILYPQKDTSYPVGNLVINYVKNINFWVKNNLDFYRYEELTNDLKGFWLVCYKPNLDYDCEISKNDKYKILETIKFYQVDLSLYKLK